MSRVKEAGSILNVDFVLSKSPHLHRAYLITVICNEKLRAVCVFFLNFLTNKLLRSLHKSSNAVIVCLQIVD